MPTFPSRRSSGGLVLASLILAACAVAGSPLSAQESDPKPAVKKGPAKAVTGTKSSAAPAGAVAAAPDLLQRRRRSIAELLEGHHYLRGMISGGAARIVDARLAGPFEIMMDHWFASDTKEIVYCASAKLMVPIPAYPVALIRVEHPAQGGERLMPRIGYGIAYKDCRNVDYKPFPELEQLRVQRRRALGHAD